MMESPENIVFKYNTGLYNMTLEIESSLPKDNDSSTWKDLVDSDGLSERIAVGVVLSVFILTAIAGNLLVIVAILTDRNLRKTGNYFLVSLALADTMVASTVMTFAVFNDVLGRWIFGAVLCKLWMSADVMCSTASILNLCAISLDRYIHIRSPLHYDTWISQGRVLLAIAVIWIMSGLISFLPIQLGWHRLGTATETDPANDVTCLLELNPIYATLSSMISFCIPCLAMILIYYRLLQYARRHVANIKMTTKFSPVVDRRTTVNGNGFSGYKMSDHKAAVTLGIIMGVFLLCWSPFFTINIISAFCPWCIPPIVFTIFTWLGYLNSTMNPVIYGIFNRQFREAFRRVLSFRGGWLCCKSGPDYGLAMQHMDSTPPLRNHHVEYGAVGTKSSKVPKAPTTVI